MKRMILMLMSVIVLASCSKGDEPEPFKKNPLDVTPKFVVECLNNRVFSNQFDPANYALCEEADFPHSNNNIEHVFIYPYKGTFDYMMYVRGFGIKPISATKWELLIVVDVNREGVFHCTFESDHMQVTAAPGEAKFLNVLIPGKYPYK